MRICFYEDGGADLDPLTTARPAFELLVGSDTIRGHALGRLRPEMHGMLVRKELVSLVRMRYPASPVNDPTWLRAAPTLLVNSRFVPGEAFVPPVVRNAHLGMCGGAVAYAFLHPEHLAGLSPASINDAFQDWLDLLPKLPAAGCVVRSAAELLEIVGFPTPADAEYSQSLPDSVFHRGCRDELFVHPTATVEAMALLDSTRGPIILSAGSRVAAFSRIEGPCFIGVNSEVSGELRDRCAIGPGCRVAGHLENVTTIGHAEIAPGVVLRGMYLGNGVRMGPGVHSEFDRGPAILIGDFARVGAGVILERGTTIGPFARLSSTGFAAPQRVPAFGVVSRDGVEPADSAERDVREIQKESIERGRAMPDAELELYRKLADSGAHESNRTLPLPFRIAA